MPVVTEPYTVLKAKIRLSLAMPLHSIGIEIMNMALRWGFRVVDLLKAYFSIISTVFIIMFYICLTVCIISQNVNICCVHMKSQKIFKPFVLISMVM